MSKKPRVSKDVAEAWPEIFNDIDINVVPIDYLHSIHIHFKNEKSWVVDVQKSLTKPGLQSQEEIEEHIQSLFEEYEDEILNVDFRLDTEKVKKDIQKRTRYFMKKRK